MNTIRVRADEVRAGDSLPGLGDGYVFETPVTNEHGYLTYPSTHGGYDAAMPDSTVLITSHDSQGEECYLIVPSAYEIQVNR